MHVGNDLLFILPAVDANTSGLPEKGRSRLTAARHPQIARGKATPAN
jgi:hypothetical protein